MNSKRENGGVEAKILLFLFCAKLQRNRRRVKERLCDGADLTHAWVARILSGHFSPRITAMETYRGVEITDSYFTGHPSMIFSTLVRSISAICRFDRPVYLYYIGVASGCDYYSALSRRVDEKKLEYQTTRMNLIYQSSSEQNTRLLEKQLVKRFQHVKADDRVWNSTGGGGGRRGSGPLFFLYLATSQAT